MAIFRKRFELSAEEYKLLEKGSRSRSDLRLKERSQTLLWRHEGLSPQEISCRLEVRLATVHERCRRWREKGISSLSDAPGRGPRYKLNESMLSALKGWASEAALNARELRDRLQAQYGLRVGLSTIKRACVRLGLVWKRTRHSLKKKRR